MSQSVNNCLKLIIQQQIVFYFKHKCLFYINNVSVEKAKKYYAVSISTLRRWDEAKKIKVIRTQGGHRRFYIPEKGGRRKIIYCRVSSSKQKSNLQNQIKHMSEKYKLQFE